MKIVSELKDLGVIMDSKLKFDRHVDSITKKASLALVSIMRNSHEFIHMIVTCTIIETIYIHKPKKKEKK